MEIKEEVMELRENLPKTPMTCNNDMIPITISSSEDSYMANSDDEDSDIESSSSKRQRLESVLPLGFLDPLTPDERKSMQTLAVVKDEPITVAAPLMSMAAPPPFVRSCKQFWKAGDYEGSNGGASTSFTDGMDHLRVHPKFLHSNATSHKWALGAFAELLDNALDEVCHGATYVHVDMLENKKDNSKMLLVEDNGGGMTPDKMRQCMSLGYSEKSKMANTIGQYGNGFKTSTMRLGADVIVFSRCQGKDGKSATQSIGMLSYTFLTSTGKEDIVVPMIDYKKCGDTWSIMARASIDDWKRNLDSIVQWSPYENEEDLLHQFDFVDAHGTRIIIYNLWEDDQGSPELDFDTDPTDIQIRGVNRDDKKIEMANKYPNSRHFLTYRHSLRSYSSILYLRIPNGFRIILRKQDVEHHNIVNDMMNCKEITYRPTMAVGETPNNSNMVAVVSLGFVKDAKCHMDIQGFNVYHKNRLIKPFWRVWNAAGSDGRGVIGVLEANFVEPAHDKQGFERTIVLQRLESKLVIIQKNYWRSNCHLIGYAKRRGPSDSPLAVEGEAASTSSAAKDKSSVANVNNKSPHQPNSNSNPANSRSIRKFKCEPSASTGDTSGNNEISIPHRETSLVSGPVVDKNSALNQIIDHTHIGKSGLEIIANLTKKNQELNESFQGVLNSLEYERDRNKSLENKLQEAQQAMEAMDKDQEIMITAVIDERERRNQEEASLKARLNDASETIQKLIQRVKQLENKPLVKCKIES